MLPLLSETGPIDIPLECTCKKVLVYLTQPEQAKVDFGQVIFGEQCLRQVRLKNEGALATKVYVKGRDGRTVPFINQEELQKKIDEHNSAAAATEPVADPVAAEGDNNEAAAVEDNDFAHDTPAQEQARLNNEAAAKQIEAYAADPFEEFIAQVQFKRVNDIDGYSQTRISFTFVPFKLGPIAAKFTLFFDNEDYCEAIPIELVGECVDVPIYVAQPEYDLNVLVYDQFYREKIVLHNRGNQPMKVQLFFPRSFKQYLEFNPTLGYIQGFGTFDIWFKFRPDRSILANCQRYLTKQDEEPPQDEYEEFTMRIPIKVTGANQVLPVKFSIRAVFSVSALTFSPPIIDFGNVFHKGASRVTLLMENHSLLPQQFSFVRLPKEVLVVTDNGTGQILPSEKYQVQFEYRPSQPTVYEEAFVVSLTYNNILVLPSDHRTNLRTRDQGPLRGERDAVPDHGRQDEAGVPGAAGGREQGDRGRVAQHLRQGHDGGACASQLRAQRLARQPACDPHGAGPASAGLREVRGRLPRADGRGRAGPAQGEAQGGGRRERGRDATGAREPEQEDRRATREEEERGCNNLPGCRSQEEGSAARARSGGGAQEGGGQEGDRRAQGKDQGAGHRRDGGRGGEEAPRGRGGGETEARGPGEGLRQGGRTQATWMQGIRLLSRR